MHERGRRMKCEKKTSANMNFVGQETFSHFVCQLWKLYNVSIVLSGITASSLPMCLRLSEVLYVQFERISFTWRKEEPKSFFVESISELQQIVAAQ